MALLTIATLLALIIPGITFGVFVLERWQNWRAARGRIKGPAAEHHFGSTDADQAAWRE